MAIDTDIKGIWTYRSLANAAGATKSFDDIKVWEAELYLEVEEGGRLHGTLGERPAVTTGREPFLTVTGEVIPGDPIVVRWRATGLPGSEYEGWIYDYAGYYTPSWPNSPRQRPAIVGTVTRTVAHDTSPAGSVFSFVAVKSDFREPRESIPLAKPALDMMASPEHRLHHQLWHASRDNWDNLSDAKKEALRSLDWQPGPKQKERPTGSADLFKNGAGEDFFYMHRRMVTDVRKLDRNIKSWRSLPQPAPLADFAPQRRIEQIGNMDGFALPPAWIVPGDVATTHWLADLRQTSTLYGKFQAWERQYTDPDFLATVSLGELGSRIEFSIHNWMHMRWASVTRDFSSDPLKRGIPIPEGRQPLDFDGKWFAPEYDHLGETFSSHVNPIFWRLHGWVDDRIDDWFRAHEKARPGTIKKKDVAGVDWFETDGVWVTTGQPWEGAQAAAMPAMDNEHAAHMAHQHGHGGGLKLDLQTMKDALTIIFGPEPGAAIQSLGTRGQADFGHAGATRFKRIDL
jgi:hypothetical protein